MPNPNLVRPFAVPACILALFLTAACGQQGGSEKARLDAVERRLDVLEKRVGPLQAPSPAAGRSAAAPSPSSVDTSIYAPGAIAVAHAAPTNSRALLEAPADSVGGFVYTGGPITLHDLSSRGVRYSGLSGVELQGWFKAAQAGRYQFGEDLRGVLGPNAIVAADCGLQMWLEDRVVGAQQGALPPDFGRGEQHVSLLVGADLQPGLYKLRLWTACVATLPREAHITADLLVKAPGDLNLRGFKPDELLHKP